MNWIIKAKALSKRYRSSNGNAVDSLDIAVERGTIFGLLGPNGAGKTTTLALLSGLLKPDSGGIEFSCGSSNRDIRRVIGYVPQELAIYTRLTGRDNLAFFGNLYGIKGAGLGKKTDELLSMVGLEDRADDLVTTYSMGMKRRLNLASGLIHEPEILLLDEPTVGIDPQSRNRIFETVLTLKERGATLLYTTHYMEEANKLCDRIAIMDRGRIILEGHPGELVRRGGLYRIEFRVRGVSQDFVSEIRRMDLIREVSVSEAGIVAMVETDANKMETIEAVGRLARERNIDLSLGNVVEPDLESLFLDITGKSLRDDQDTV